MPPYPPWPPWKPMGPPCPKPPRPTPAPPAAPELNRGSASRSCPDLSMCCPRLPSAHRWAQSHLSDIDQAAHEVLVAESLDSILGLVPRSIFHNSGQVRMCRCWPELMMKLTRIPTSTSGQRPNPSIQQFHQECHERGDRKGNKMKPARSYL